MTAISHVHATEDAIVFRLTIATRKIGADDDIILRAPGAEFSMSMLESFYGVRKHPPYSVIGWRLVTLLDRGNLPVDPVVIFPDKQGPLAGGYPLPFFPEPYRRTSTFWSAMNGFPSRTDGHFVRMLYLSAGTISSFGFGDIVPLTTEARLLTLVESLIGLILIGLFLNAIVQGVSPSFKGVANQQSSQFSNGVGSFNKQLQNTAKKKRR